MNMFGLILDIKNDEISCLDLFFKK